MPDAPPINRPSVGRTFIVAISILGVVACGQLALFGYAFFQRLKHPQAVVDRTLEASVDPVLPPTPAPAASGDESETLAVDQPFESEDPEPDAAGKALAAAKIVPADPSIPITPPPKPVPMRPVPFEVPPENRFQELLNHGRKLRERGDMTAALTRFREAQVLEFQSAEPIYEIAITLEQMRLNDRAAEMWRRIYDMGRDAGQFYEAAEVRLKQSQQQALMAAKAAQTGPVSSTKRDAVMGVGEVRLEDARISGSLKKFTLYVPLKARPDQSINVKDVTIKVLFYDLVDGKNVVQTSANVSSRFGSSPVDWEGNEPEILEVDYDLPMPPPNSREDRKYFGYIVRLYYRGELQDTRAEPAVLNAKFPAPNTLDSDSAQ